MEDEDAWRRADHLTQENERLQWEVQEMKERM
jgi:hypothetical protein